MTGLLKLIQVARCAVCRPRSNENRHAGFVACKTYADIWRNMHGACTAGVLVYIRLISCRVFAEH